MVLNLAFFSIFLTFCWLFEFIVVNEEILLMLCFLAFVFNLYISFKQAIFDGLNQKSVTLRVELLESLRSQDSSILARLNSTGSGSEKVAIGSRLYQAVLLSGFIVKALEKKMFAISGLFGVLNSLYIL
jgi:hypothetical protein